MDITTHTHTHTHTHTTWWWDPSNCANERARALGVGCLLFPSCMVGVGFYVRGHIFAEGGTLFCVAGPGFSALRCLEALSLSLIQTTIF